MNKVLTAIALTIAVPAMAHAQVAASAPKSDCCDKMKGGCKMDCCKGMADAKSGSATAADPHGGHDKAKPADTAAPHQH